VRQRIGEVVDDAVRVQLRFDEAELVLDARDVVTVKRIRVRTES
jgi:hypothetical protein